jgi:ABC-type antimicrobial peptide transport system permease subunit
MARRFFGDTDPIGRHFRFADSPQQVFDIVGVVKDAKYGNLRDPAPPTFYLPYFQHPGPFGMTFELRGIADPRVVLASLRGVVREIDPKLRLNEARTLDDVVNATLHREEILAQVGGFFSVFALALACLGIYGVLSFAVVRRTREIGIRVALGAQRRDVHSLVIGKGLKLVLAGSLIGLAGASAATRFVSNLLYGVSPTDPLTFAGVAFLLVVVAALASWLPARRAARVNPIVALRNE